MSTIIACKKNCLPFIIFFEKSNPLTLYELKHILFQIEIFLRYGRMAQYQTFVDVCLESCGMRHVFNELSDDSKIEINQPCFINLTQIRLDMKPREQIIFDKPRYDQGYCHADSNKNFFSHHQIFVILDENKLY